MSDNTKEKTANQENPQDQNEGDYKWKCTLLGRVVYKRKKHYFGSKDFLRIWEKTKIVFPAEWLSNMTLIQDFRDVNTELTGMLLPFSYQPTSPDDINTLKTIIDEINIDLLVEIIEKIPFIPQRMETQIAEWIYWHIHSLIDKLIGGK